MRRVDIEPVEAQKLAAPSNSRPGVATRLVTPALTSRSRPGLSANRLVGSLVNGPSLVITERPISTSPPRPAIRVVRVPAVRSTNPDCSILALGAAFEVVGRHRPRRLLHHDRRQRRDQQTVGAAERTISDSTREPRSRRAGPLALGGRFGPVASGPPLPAAFAGSAVSRIYPTSSGRPGFAERHTYGARDRGASRPRSAYHEDPWAELFDHIDELRRSPGKVAVATLVNTRGTTPRKEGAKMLVGEGGSVLGSVTIGGCVDAQVIEQTDGRARSPMRAPAPRAEPGRRGGVGDRAHVRRHHRGVRRAAARCRTLSSSACARHTRGRRAGGDRHPARRPGRHEAPRCWTTARPRGHARRRDARRARFGRRGARRDGAWAPRGRYWCENARAFVEVFAAVRAPARRRCQPRRDAADRSGPRARLPHGRHRRPAAVRNARAFSAGATS